MTLLSISSLLLLASPVLSQYMTCPNGFGIPSGPKYGKPQLAPGYTLQLVANGFTKPRTILFDSIGRLLMVAAGDGVYSLTVNRTSADSNCWYVGDTVHMIKDPSLNHGLALSRDGRTLLTTSSSDLKSWSFNPTRKSVGFPQTIVTGMDQDGHSTRTLLVPKNAPNKVIVSRGSSANIDAQAANISSGHSQLKSFTWTNQQNYGQMFDSDGDLLAWGLRNSVGLAEDSQGHLWSVENSADNVDRYGTDFHQDNPAEELNYHGDPTKKPSNPAPNYGYPNCLAAWNPKDVPQDSGLQTGQQFANEPKGDADADCKNEKKYVRPRLAFQAHMAPLDIVFYNPNTTTNQTACQNGFGCDHVGDAFVSFHGSWDRNDPVGYKLSYLEYGRDGQPKEKADSMKAAKDIMWNEDNSKCPDRCFRPVGLAFDKFGNLWMTSDATGELYVISRTGNFNSSGTNSTNSTNTANTSSTKGTASSVRSNGAAMMGLVVFLGFLFL